MTPLNIKYLKEKTKEHPKNGNSPIHRAKRIIKILERDNFKCVKCGATTKLTIDHIDGRKFAKFNNAQKYKIDMCQTLCITCHKRKNYSV